MILGLDFDGVLHPVNSVAEPKFCRLELLEAWLRAHPSVDVVITSSWREYHPLDEMRSYFAEDLQRRVRGVTPMAHRLFGPARSRSDEVWEKARYERQAELEAWLQQTGSSEPWLALDDDPGLFEPGCRRVVICESRTGLTSERLNLLHEVELNLHHDAVWNIEVVVRTIVPELELVIVTSDGDAVELRLRDNVPGVRWRELRVGQRLKVRLQGKLTPRALSVEPSSAD